jgi:DNA-binding winged helix-turn-helix (wHTH) protein
LTDSRWQKLCTLDRERWEGWILRLSPELREIKNCIEYFTISGGRLEREPTAAELKRFEETSLFIDDRKSQVRYRGRSLKGLNRKGVLYDFLKVLIQSAPAGLEKDELSALVWGEDYNPSLHDPRIYVATQRIRAIFKDARLVVQHRGRYAINPERSGILIREKRGRSQSLNGNEKRILTTLQSRARNAKTIPATTRGELQKILGMPEATLKRGLKSLLQKREIIAQGAGRTRSYSL